MIKTEKITSVKPIGKHSTIDIEVDHPSHTFFANSMATSNSHAVSYAMNTYLAAYTKAHFPHEFFTSSLYYSKNSPNPQERIQEIVSDAKSFNIDIRPPSILYLNKNFKLIEKTIFFGMVNIKGIGDSIHNKLNKSLDNTCNQLNKTLSELTWMDLLILVFSKINTTSVKSLINTGGLSHLKIDRKKLQYEYEKYNILCGSQKTKEQQWIEQNYHGQWTTLEKCLQALCQIPISRKEGCATKKRHMLVQEVLVSLSNSPYSLKDNPTYIAEREEELLGTCITCTTLDSCDIKDANANCQDFLKGIKKQIYWIPVQISRKHEIITKTKKKMCFLTVSDLEGEISSTVVFPEPYAQYRPLLFNRNNIMIVGTQGKDKGSFIVKKVYQL